MSPFNIGIMLWYFTRVGLYHGDGCDSSGAMESTEELVNAGLLRRTDTIEITEGGKVYCEALCAVQLPIQKWTIPASKRANAGYARAANLSPARRSEIASAAATARWAK